MNMFRNFLYVAAFSSATLFAACDSGKKGHDSHEGHAHQMPASSDSKMLETPDFSASESVVKAQIINFTNHYLLLKDALVNTDVEETRKAAMKCISALEAMDTHDLNDEELTFFNAHFAEIKKSVVVISESSDVEEQRSKFFDLSNGTYGLVKAFQAKAADVYFQYCPMAFDNTGAGWLSDKKEIRNPYFGDKMLKCGKVKETL